MTYQFRLREEPFDFSYEFYDYENRLLESDPGLEPEFDEFEATLADLEEEEEEARRGARAAGSTIRGRTPPVQLRRPPPRRRRPPRTIIRPWRVSAGVIHEPSICTCPEQTCPQHGSEYIRWVQSTLNGILGMRLPLNGVLTRATRSAIRSFQEREKLPVTGIVGPDTERALIAARSGQSAGAGATKPVEPAMMEPPEPAATPPEPGMNEPAEPAPTSSDAELDFEWEAAPLGQRETQRLTYSGQVRFPSGEILRVVTGLPIGKNEDYWDPTGSGNPLLDTGPAHKDKKLSTSFTVGELTTSGGVSADIARIDPKFVECLQRLRDHVRKGVKITSGFRSWKRNRDVYAGRKNADGTPKKPTSSEHCGGRAADIKIAGMNGLDIGKAAIDACGPNIGVGLANTYAHIDVRGFAAAWNYGGVKDSWVAEIKRYQRAKGGSRKPSTAGAKPRPDAAKPPAELVRFAQRVLNATEREQLDDDGNLGRLTRDALARFRTRYGLGPGGVLDGPTELALVQRTIEELAQQSIFPQLGVLDTKTGPAIARFKSERGLGFDATIDAATRAALTQALQARSSSASSSPSRSPAPAGAATGGKVDPSVVARIDTHRERIERIAQEADVSPHVFRGIIAAESGGKEKVGANTRGYKGLMQCGKGEEQLVPEGSLRCGAKKYRQFTASMQKFFRDILKQNFDALPEDTRLRIVMAGYNAGPVTVQRAMRFAGAAGDLARWLAPEHYLRALLSTGAYNPVESVLAWCLEKGHLSGDTLASDLARLSGKPLDEIRSLYAPAGKWNTERLAKALRPLLFKEKDSLKNNGSAPFEAVRLRATPSLFCAARYKQAHTAGYLDKIVRYKQFYAARG